MTHRWLLPVALVSLAACGEHGLTLDFKLQGVADFKDIYRLETVVAIDSTDPSYFSGTGGFQAVATGVGVELRDVDGSGRLAFLITHDAGQGFEFSPSFSFHLLPPAHGYPPPLVVRARALGAADVIGATTTDVSTSFEDGSAEIVVVDSRCQGARCTGNQTCCNSGCSDVDNDPASCGACGQACDGNETCSGAKCRCAGGSACTLGKTCFADTGCYDLQNDPYNCGAKGVVCNPGETCSMGTCRCGGAPSCGVGTSCCGSTCAAPGHGCPCGGGPECGAPNFCCDAAMALCVDRASDNGNCGSCGTACSAPLACSGGQCKCNGVACASGDTCCGTGCASLADDPNNCGACGKKCGVGERCGGGQCLCGSTQCANGQLCCNQACVPSDVNNCGGCGALCGAGETCSNGSCSCSGGASCGNGQYQCCPDGCFNLATGLDSMNNPGHCGMTCSAPVCAAPKACIGGACLADACGGCTRGNSCDTSTPTPTCRCGVGAACDVTSPTPDCCMATCVSFLTNPNHCGGCNAPSCASGICVAGVCAPPDMAHPDAGTDSGTNKDSGGPD